MTRSSLTGDVCPICGRSSSKLATEKGGYQHLWCLQCSVVFISPRPSAQEICAHYQDPSYFAGEQGQGYSDYASVHRALEPHFQRRLGLLERRLEGPGRLLDFGCADGHFLNVAQKRGWQVSGVELSLDMAKHASRTLGVPVWSSMDQVTEFDLDAITLWEVIEHLADPVAELARIRDHLRPGGILALSTPNVCHWQAVREPDEWLGYQPPSHVILLSVLGLVKALRLAGYGEIDVRKVAPLPPLPGWLRTMSRPLEQALSTGQAQSWKLSLLAWRLVRIAGWFWQLVFDRGVDIFARLEAFGVRLS